MLAAFAGCLWARRQAQPFRILAAVCVIVLAIDPLALLAPGFQLSFAAVFLLFRAALQRGMTGPPLLRPVSRLLVMQGALLFGLFPLVAAHFDRFAWLAPPVNLLAVPLFNLVIVPPCLLALVLDGPLESLATCCWQPLIGPRPMILDCLSGIAAWEFASVDLLLQGSRLEHASVLVSLAALAAFWLAGQEAGLVEPPGVAASPAVSAAERLRRPGSAGCRAGSCHRRTNQPGNCRLRFGTGVSQRQRHGRPGCRAISEVSRHFASRQNDHQSRATWITPGAQLRS